MNPCGSDWKQTAPSGLRLSIIVTTYNYADVLYRAVDSVLSQPQPPCELLVIDDGSQDDTLKLLRDYSVPAGFRAGYLTQPNAGPAAARNHAVRYAAGRWVLFLDADDELHPDAITSILGLLDKRPDLDLLVGGHISRQVDGREKYHAPSTLPEDPERRLVDYLLHKRIGLSHGCSVFRRDRVEARPYPEYLRQSEDLAVFAYLLSCPQVGTLDQPLAIIHKHPDSLRHDASLAPNNADRIVDSVFERLPPSMRRYENAYRAQRALSAFRVCYRAGYREEALACYADARRRAPARALRWAYLSKWLRLKLGR